MSFQVGYLNRDGSANVQGLSYTRSGNTAQVPDNTNAVFLQIGRSVVAFAGGGYEAPFPDEEE